MKICISSSSFPRFNGDIWGPWILEYATQLVKMGCEVYVLSPRTNGIGEKPNEIINKVHIHRFSYWPLRKWQILASPPGMMPNLMHYKIAKFQVFPFLLIGWLNLLNIVLRYRIDLVFAQWVIPSGFWGVLTSFLTRKPIFISAQGAEFYVRNPLFRGFIRSTMQHSDKVLPVSYHMKELAKSFGIIEEKLQVVPNAVNIEVFKRVQPHQTKGKFRVLTIRRLVPEKRVEDLLQAFSEFQKSKKDVSLLIIGDGPERSRLEDLTRSLQIADVVEFHGFVPNAELIRYYNLANVYVLSSIQEGLSLSLLEAMACELPIISTNIAGNPEVIVHKKNGFLVSPKKPSDIVKGLEFFYNNREKIAEYGKASREVVQEKFTSNTVAQSILNLYKEIKYF